MMPVLAIYIYLLCYSASDVVKSSQKGKLALVKTSPKPWTLSKYE